MRELIPIFRLLWNKFKLIKSTCEESELKASCCCFLFFLGVSSSSDETTILLKFDFDAELASRSGVDSCKNTIILREFSFECTQNFLPWKNPIGWHFYGLVSWREYKCPHPNPRQSPLRCHVVSHPSSLWWFSSEITLLTAHHFVGNKKNILSYPWKLL